MTDAYKFTVTFLIAKAIEVETTDEIQAEWQAAKMLTKKERELVEKIRIDCARQDYPITTDFYTVDEDIKSWWD